MPNHTGPAPYIIHPSYRGWLESCGVDTSDTRRFVFFDKVPSSKPTTSTATTEGVRAVLQRIAIEEKG